MSQTMKTKKIAILGMLCAISYVVMYVGRIPIVMFLKYDPKDVIITIGGFLFGPLSAFLVSLLVSFVEMFTVSDTGIIGFIMNVLSTCAFACAAAYLYKKKHTLKGAVMGLVVGSLLMTVVMVLWNYLITPLYLGYPREAVVELLLPVFVPFNLLKAGLNTALTLLLYNPVISALRRGRLLPPSTSSIDPAKKKRMTAGTLLLSLTLLATCVLLVLVFMKKI